MARKTFKSGGATRFDTGGDIFKPEKPRLPAELTGASTRAGVRAVNPTSINKSVSKPMVQDISGADRSADDAANARLAKKRGVSVESLFTGAGGGGGGARPAGGARASGSSRPAGGAGGAASSTKPAGETPEQFRARRAADAVRFRDKAIGFRDEAVKQAGIAKAAGASKPAAPKAAAAAPKEKPSPFAKDKKGAYIQQGSAGSTARLRRMAGNTVRALDILNPISQATKATMWGGKKLFKPAIDADRAADLAKMKKAAEAPGASRYAKDRYQMAKETGSYAKGGKTESPAMMKKEIAFFKKKKAPASLVKHEEAELKKSDNPFASANAKAAKKGGNPFAKGKSKNPFAKADGKKGKPFPKAKSKPKNAFGFAKGGSIDGVAKRGHTKCKRT